MQTAVQFIAIAALVGLTACAPASSLDPPKILQLACLTDKSQDEMFLVFDTALKTVKWANARTVVRGAFSATPLEYRFNLTGTPLTQSAQGVVNRFDGRLYLIWGPPLRKPLPGDLPQGPDIRVWHCRKQKAGPLL